MYFATTHEITTQTSTYILKDLHFRLSIIVAI